MLPLANHINEAFFNKSYIPGTSERQTYYSKLNHDEKRQLYSTLRYALAFWLSLQKELPQLARKKHLQIAHCCSFIALEKVLSNTSPIYHVGAELKRALNQLKVGWSLQLYLAWIKKIESFECLFAQVKDKTPICLLLKEQPQLSISDLFGHPPLGIRLHSEHALLELDPLSISQKIGPKTIVLKKNSDEAKGLFSMGMLSYQNPSAQLLPIIFKQVVRRIENTPLAILDACAAPGAKTHLIYELMRPIDSIICCDLPERTDALLDNLKRAPLELFEKTSIIGHDWESEALPDDKKFDFILLDGPCTGSGVTRKHPDALWRLNAEQINMAHNKLVNIASRVAKHLKPGGVLLYATCSLLSQENDAVIEKITTENLKPLEFHLDSAQKTAYGWQILPDNFHDGLYYAALQKSL